MVRDGSMARIRRMAAVAAKAAFEKATTAVRFTRRTRAVTHQPLIQDDSEVVPIVSVFHEGGTNLC